MIDEEVLDGLFTTIKVKEETVASLIDMITQKDARIEELTNLLLQQSGVLEVERIISAPDSSIKDPIPIGKNSNWRKRKAILEKRFSKVSDPGELEDDGTNDENLG